MHDDELAGWQRQWQDDAPIPAAVQARAVADDRRYRRYVVAEYLLNALFLGASLAYALWSDTTVGWILLLGIWGLGLPAFAFTVWNRRGLWRAADTSGRAFVALSLRRCRRGLVAVRASYAMLAAVVAFNVAAFLGAFTGVPFETARFGIVLTLVIAVAYLVALALVHRRLQRRLRALEALASQLAGC